jgi:hypothetical protein
MARPGNCWRRCGVIGGTRGVQIGHVRAGHATRAATSGWSWRGIARVPRGTARALAGDSTAPTILLLKSDTPKIGKTRLHFDLCPIDGDQQGEVDWLVPAGATRVDIGQGDVRWVVLGDPRGNEFCVMPKVIPPEPQPFHHLDREQVARPPSGDHH